MASGVAEECKKTDIESQNVDIAESVDNFQKFMYELFEKNGILNDLRAYLRGHIINVLRSTQTGGLPSCQKHFIQRLELPFQAINILIVEYLLHLEFSYSLSVFISEIPLANMVFHLAKSLMQRNTEEDLLDIRFTENDVWSILNYLGVPCDSEHASRIIQMYKNDENTSLLVCILKCQWMNDNNTLDLDKESEDTLTSQSTAVSGDDRECYSQYKIHPKPEKCKHLKFCKTCQNHILNIKDKYNKKKKHVYKNVKSSVSQSNIKHVMDNIGVLERSLVNELFHELKSVYESEMEMVKIEEEKRIKRSMATHALQLQRERDELEQSFKVREAELERNVVEKKKFLWGLARALRDQHQHMSRAMHDVRIETNRLTAKEESLKTQIAEAEQILHKRGEDMSLQISNELSLLKTHLNAMKKERECINKERAEIENLKTIEETASKNKTSNIVTEVNSHYDLLRNELDILKKYLESTKMSPKCMIEKSTVTDLCNVNSKLNIGLNNHNQNSDRNRNDDCDDRLKNQVVNDFKKKNVNFRPSKLDEIYRDRSHTHSNSSGSSEVGDTSRPSVTYQRDIDANIIQTLREENTRLKECSRHQQAHIEVLSRAATPLPCVSGAGPAPAPRARPRTAPPSGVEFTASAAVSTPNTYQPFPFLRNMNTSVSANTVGVGWRKGAGEEFNIFNDGQPRVLVPGDTIPFVGVLRNRHNINKRQMLGQWSAVRSRTCPLVGVSKRTFSPLRERQGSSSPTVRVSDPKASCSLQKDHVVSTISVRDKSPHRQTTSDTKRNRDKSPKSVLKEAKAKLRNVKDLSIVAHEKSPNSVLREAKLRLRKLEIEAEAMEKSYLDFRKRQSELRLERNTRLMIQASESINTQDFANLTKYCGSDKQANKHVGRLVDPEGTKRTYSLQKLDKTSTKQIDPPLTDCQKSMRNDFDKYLREYQTKIAKTHFRNQTVADIVNPIPEVYKKVNAENSKVNTNYLETPLLEFRKFYHSYRKKLEGYHEKVTLKKITPKVSDLSETDPIESDDSQPVKVEQTKQGNHEKVTFKKLTPKVMISESGPIESDDSQPDEVEQTKHSKNAELEILKENINKIYNISNNEVSKLDQKKTQSDSHVDEQNILKVEVENVNEMEKALNLSIVVESTVLDTGVVLISPDHQSPNHVSGQVAVILSPKASTPRSNKTIDESPEISKRCQSPEQQANLTRNDVLDIIFNIDENNEKSNTEINLDDFEDILKDNDYDNGEDFDDNLSADVDNYNSHTELPNSPISLVKTSEDENFWD